MDDGTPQADPDGEATPACPRCGSSVDPGDAFCEECGTALGDRPAPLPPGPAPDRPGPAVPGAPEPGDPDPSAPTASTPVPGGRPAVRPCVACGAAAVGPDGYCERCGTRQPGDRDHVELDVPGIGAASDKGRRHSRNEDAMAVAWAESGIVAVVSDGVSSSPHPEDASRTAADTGAAVLGERLAAGDDPRTATLAAVERAATSVSDLAESEFHAPACTYVSAYVGGGAITVGWVGDSRAYWLTDGPGLDGAAASTLLTEDDSWAGRMVAWGVMTEAEAQADNKAHVLTSWLGADAGELDPRVRTFVPPGPGAVIVCSDGLWNYLPEADTLRAAAPDARADPRGTAAALVQQALDAGGHDNVTVVVVPFPPPEQANRERER